MVDSPGERTIYFLGAAIPSREISNTSVMVKEPLVSAHIITFNQEAYVARAIEGVLMQETDFPIELVIGEDCSTDRTREIVLEYQRNYPDTIRVVTSGRNVGMRRNELRTTYACRGRYIAFCEGDDCWHHPRKLQKQVDILNTYPEVGLVHSGADVYNVESGRRTPWFWGPRGTLSKRDTFTEILTDRHPHIYNCTVCMRKGLLLSMYRNNPDSFADDFGMTDIQTWLETSRVSRLEFINESLATYNELPESAWNTKDPVERIRRYKSAYRLRMHFVQKYRMPLDVENEIHRKYNPILLSLAFVVGDGELALGAARKIEATTGKLVHEDRVKLFGSTHPVARPLIRDYLRGVLLLRTTLRNAARWLKGDS